ncbi:hypothetical protein ES705_06725 [subsurface metagenome]
MKLADYISLYVPKDNNAIASIFDKRIGLMNNDFLKDYFLEIKDCFLASGKRIRPLLTIEFRRCHYNEIY